MVNSVKRVTKINRTKTKLRQNNTMDLCYLLTLLISKFVQVEISDGVLEGQIVENPYGCPFFSFKGIPYAEPPIGDLRFKAPQPIRPWQGIRPAISHGSRCYQYNISSPEGAPLGSEDCLFLNVYSPNIQPDKPIPVMVFIHGGAFVVGGGDDLGPEYLIRKDVVIVTLQYRLEILGFLSLDTEDIPGNAGMKDQVAALRWVKKNIKHFGGDPDNITVFGESAGGASVSFHLVSPMTKGLFNRAITQSGSLASYFPNTFRARTRALLLARELGCNSTDDKEISQFLKTQPVQNLVQSTIPITYYQSQKIGPRIYYGVVNETQFGDSERFFYGDSLEVLRNGIHEGLDVINGYTADEGVLFFALGADANQTFEQANHYLEFYVPAPMADYIPLKTQMEVGKRFKDFYMKSKIASKETLDHLLIYFSFDYFVYGTMIQEKIIAKNNKNKSYLYKFSCVSEINTLRNDTALGQLFDYRPVVGHGDDVFYLFPNMDVDMNSTAFKMVDQLTTLWTNFAKYGDPTPDDSLGVKWLPYTIENQDYLDIGENLVPGTYPEKEDVEFWEKMFKEYLPRYLP
ncbi:unnamed protein product [Euphydryas editha]|uniref:Carboxylic ester hydrolase n=1 Tax=Euphydryas editha TaxID=104508 RepID=A0AAU9TEH1_EUPED|nr:unnamed protein product [Euphydryas editha]